MLIVAHLYEGHKGENQAIIHRLRKRRLGLLKKAARHLRFTGFFSTAQSYMLENGPQPQRIMLVINILQLTQIGIKKI